MQLQAEVLKRGKQAVVVIGNNLMNMYAKYGYLGEPSAVFDHLVTKDFVTWSAMITGYAQNGFGQEALTLYASMTQDEANAVTLVCLLKACASVGALQQGKQLQAKIMNQARAGT